jgi:DNA-binding PadR family transcriptional regulator
LTAKGYNYIIYLTRLGNGGDGLSYSSEILRGNTETIILAILIKKDSYGYEIMKTIIEGGKGLFSIKDATVYTAFKRMEKDKLITSYWGDEDGSARRKYYRITPKGKEVYVQKVNEWKEIQVVLNNLIGGNL